VDGIAATVRSLISTLTRLPRLAAFGVGDASCTPRSGWEIKQLVDVTSTGSPPAVLGLGDAIGVV
jgi:hypothetical protein